MTPSRSACIPLDTEFDSSPESWKWNPYRPHWADPVIPFPPAQCTSPFKKWGTFDREKLKKAISAHFPKSDYVGPSSYPFLWNLIGFMEVDDAITDIRWMAYMLATAYKEAWVTKDANDKHTHFFEPTEEKKPKDGGGVYFHLVKVHRLKTGGAIVTDEKGKHKVDGTNGTSSPLHHKDEASLQYVDGKPQEHIYDGRGFVHITWWYNYAKVVASLKKAGIAPAKTDAGTAKSDGGSKKDVVTLDFGEPLDLLYNPDKARDAQVAYWIMSVGMRTGEIFANGHKFTDYFGATTDYVKAREMVNAGQLPHMVKGKLHAGDPATVATIARIAKQFETCLLEAA